ncbi:MAG: NAD(P)-binding domain-containing protein, partial [Chthoniobacterales bacterium]
MRSIAIVGLGYVGLPLALQFAKSGVSVVGLDVDSKKIDSINAGASYIQHISSTTITQELQSKRLRASLDFSIIRDVEAVIICVPTPLTKHREPDISYILRTAESIAPHLQKGTLVVLESTTYPGTTDEDLRSVL